MSLKIFFTIKIFFEFFLIAPGYSISYYSLAQCGLVHIYGNMKNLLFLKSYINQNLTQTS